MIIINYLFESKLQKWHYPSNLLDKIQMTVKTKDSSFFDKI
jgi:hypothetical protein